MLRRVTVSKPGAAVWQRPSFQMIGRRARRPVARSNSPTSHSMSIVRRIARSRSVRSLKRRRKVHLRTAFSVPISAEPGSLVAFAIASAAAWNSWSGRKVQSPTIRTAWCPPSA